MSLLGTSPAYSGLRLVWCVKDPTPFMMILSDEFGLESLCCAHESAWFKLL